MLHPRFKRVKMEKWGQERKKSDLTKKYDKIIENIWKQNRADGLTWETEYIRMYKACFFFLT